MWVNSCGDVGCIRFVDVGVYSVCGSATRGACFLGCESRMVLC